MTFHSWTMAAAGSAAAARRANGAFIATFTGPALRSQPSFIPTPRRRRPSRAPAEEFLPSITWSRLPVAHTYGTQELSNAAVAALAGRKACLLSNHGVIAVGADLPAALALAGEVENLAAQYCAALSIGEVRILDQIEMHRVVEKFRSYGKPDATDSGLVFGGTDIKKAIVKGIDDGD